jgi:hypothetical protein
MVVTLTDVSVAWGGAGGTQSLALCSLHHGGFDANVLCVMPDFRIQVETTRARKTAR